MQQLLHHVPRMVTCLCSLKAPHLLGGERLVAQLLLEHPPLANCLERTSSRRAHCAAVSEDDHRGGEPVAAPPDDIGLPSQVRLGGEAVEDTSQERRNNTRCVKSLKPKWRRGTLIDAVGRRHRDAGPSNARGGKHRSCDAKRAASHWWRSAAVITGEIMGTGVLSLPTACARLGWVMGMSSSVSLAARRCTRAACIGMQEPPISGTPRSATSRMRLAAHACTRDSRR